MAGYSYFAGGGGEGGGVGGVQVGGVRRERSKEGAGGQIQAQVRVQVGWDGGGRI